METLLSIFLSVFLVSLISFVGIFFLALGQKKMDNLLEIFIAFACGSLLGDTFFHLLPESVETLGEEAFIWVVFSFVFFFALEKFFYWRHCHEGHCEIHPFTYLNLIGDGLHNFLDGGIIAASFLARFPLGLGTTLAVIFHEIPQEIGDFSILLYGGIKRKRALWLNFLSGLTALAGAAAVYLFADKINGLTEILLPFAAGNFLYLAGTDIIPELHEKGKHSPRNSIYQFLSLVSGLALMWILKIFLA